MPTDTPQPTFVLVNPQMGENIGAAARAMWNFGLDRMRLVAPRDGWPNPGAVAMAAGAGRLLDEAQLAQTTAEAVADCTFVMATTARNRDLTKPIYAPEHAMQVARERIGAGEKVAVLFGPERAGLENRDIALANAIISVPVNPDFASLNLAQCVLLTAYEWRRHAVEFRAGIRRAGGRAMGKPDRGGKARRSLRGPDAAGGLLLSRTQGRQHEAEPAQSLEPHAAHAGGCADAARRHAANGALERTPRLT